MYLSIVFLLYCQYEQQELPNVEYILIFEDVDWLY